MTEDVGVCDHAGEFTSCLRFSSRRSPRSPRNDPRVSWREHNIITTVSVIQNKEICSTVTLCYELFLFQGKSSARY